MKEIVKQEPKQETLEEAAENYANMHQDVSANLGKPLVKGVFEDGAAWQAERMYSQEEVLKQLNHLIRTPSSKLDKYTDDGEMLTMKWFEQFKKK